MRFEALRPAVIVYAALVLGPLPVLAPVSPWPSLALGVVLGGGIGAIAVRRIELPGAVLTLPGILAGFVLPLVWLIPLASRAETLLDFFFSPFFVGASAALVWLLTVIIASERRKRARLDTMSTTMTFEARPPPAQRRQQRLAVGTLAVLVGVAIVTVVVIDSDAQLSAFVWLPAMIPVWLQLIQGETTHSVTVADIGLGIEKSIHEWETIKGVDVTDEALVVRRTDWYRTSLQFDREDIENSDAVVRAINEHVGGTPGTTLTDSRDSSPP
jgi:hypothetical protein